MPAGDACGFGRRRQSGPEPQFGRLFAEDSILAEENPIIAPYGSWTSPVTAGAIVAESVTIGSVAIDGDAILWTESRPAEGGRNVIVRATAHGAVSDVNPPPFNARTRVHEYGGGAWLASGGTVWFSNYDDQRIYRQDAGAAPLPITPPAPLRYADTALDRAHGSTPGAGRLICVREDHTDPAHIVNAIVAVPADGIGPQTVLAPRLGLRVVPPPEPGQPRPGVAVLEPPGYALG